LEVYGDGEQSRCFADVADVVRAILDLMDCEQAAGQVFNIGSTQEITISELAKRVIQLADSQSKIIYLPYEKAYAPGFEDMRRRVPSIEKIFKYTGFSPQFSLDQSLNRVISYESAA
jgi:UDP-glucose 4-epimerase